MPHLINKNIVANYLGQGWVAIMNLAFIPTYIKCLGIEAYGLIGLFALMQACLIFLDMGMTPALSREMARFTGGAHTSQSVRDLLRSIEVVAFFVSIAIGYGVWSASDWLACNWLKADDLSNETVANAFTVMGIVVALRLIEGIYRSCVIGLQEHIIFNIINSTMATVRSLGAIVILFLVSNTIEAFFLWQGVVSFISLLVLAAVTYRTLPKPDQVVCFSINALKDVGKFAGGMIGITFLYLLLVQIDKIFLSRLLTLTEYGHYMLASTVAGSLFMLCQPIAQASFPRLNELHARHDKLLFETTYHNGAQLVSVIMGSAAVILIFFSEEILLLWTQDVSLAKSTAMLVSLLALGNLLNGLMWIPNQAQLAHGWTSLGFQINIIAVLAIVPAILFIVPLYGAVGAASVWVFLNVGYVTIGIFCMHKKILQSEMYSWYKNDLLYPFGASILTAMFMKNLIEFEYMSFFSKSFYIFIVSISIFVSSGMAVPNIRKKIIMYVIALLKFRK